MASVNSWKQSGAVYLWRYAEADRNYPGWHVAFDPAGLKSVVDLLQRMAGQRDTRPVLRTIQLAGPTPSLLARPGANPQQYVSPSRLRVVVTDEVQWLLVESSDDVVLTMDRTRASEFGAWLAAHGTSFDTTFAATPPVWHWGLVHAREVAG